MTGEQLICWGNEDYDLYPPRYADGYVVPVQLAAVFEVNAQLNEIGVGA